MALIRRRISLEDEIRRQNEKLLHELNEQSKINSLARSLDADKKQLKELEQKCSTSSKNFLK